jgi:hypothetical protein
VVGSIFNASDVMISLAGKELEIGIENFNFTYQSKFFNYFIKLTGLNVNFIYSEKALKM